MSKFTHDVIVIGGGSAGLSATAGYARLGLKTALIEKERLGGDCLYYGCVPSKTLIRSAAVNALAAARPSFGLPPLSPAPVELRGVMDRVRGVIAALAPHDSPERFRGLGAEVLFGGARLTSPHEVQVDGQRLSAANILIATGSVAAGLPIPGLRESGYLTNREVFDLDTLPKRLITIGAGPIGVELSQAFARLGSRVTILDVAPQVLPREDPDMAAVVASRLKAEGIELRLGVGIEKVERNGELVRVTCLNPDGSRGRVEGDRILLAAGREGALDGLDLPNAGVKVERGFIPVDAGLRTSQPNILALGDCNGKFLFTHVAGAEAAVAVQRVALRLPVRMRYDRVPWCTFTDPELASVGHNELRAKAEGLSYRVVESRLEQNDRAQAEGQPEGKIKVLIDPRGRVIGAQIVSAIAGELIAPWLFAIRHGYKLREMMGVIYPYPTLSEIHRKVAAEHYGPRLFNARVRSLLRFLFGYRGGV